MNESLCKSCENYGKYPISKYDISMCPYCNYKPKMKDVEENKKQD